MRIDANALHERSGRARALLDPCVLCPRNCRTRRIHGETGPCRVGAVAYVASYGPHFGEEAPLTGTRGSGAVFFAGCSLHCLYCQNSDISRATVGVPVSEEGLAALAIDLQERGCHNLNLVTPTHVLPQILAGLAEARRHGFDLPIVWNCGGYESVEALRLLEGVVDIYMPDFKYGIEIEGRRWSGIRDYPVHARAALREMHRQVGDLVLDDTGVAVRGLLVRHLVLPEDRAGTAAVVSFLSRTLSSNTWINVMDQYRPADRARTLAGMNRTPTSGELAAASRVARQAGLHRGIFPEA